MIKDYDPTLIPKGHYCYSHLYFYKKEVDFGEDGKHVVDCQKTKPCPYYTPDEVDYNLIGYCELFSDEEDNEVTDSCKICGINGFTDEEIEEEYMSWYKQASDKKEMEEFFQERTRKHIERVKKYCEKIYLFDTEIFDGLIERGEVHDQSKYEDPEKEPYVYITWDYKCKYDGIEFEIPEEIQDRMNEASNHHVLHNKHHPESHQENKTDLINRDDRDKPPEEMIDATKMTDLDIGEMVADWLSMSEEKSDNPKDWADKNVNVRWKFDDDQRDLIYEIIESVWEK